MKIIGLCGGSGSGKGTVCDIFRGLGVPSIDTDAVYRELTNAPSECLRALADEFGNQIITEDGVLNRIRLADIVFSGNDSSNRLARLNAIAHKYILDETRRRLNVYRDNGSKIAIVDAPVLFESGFDSECDEIVCVIADREIRLERIMARDSLTIDGAERRIDSQISDAELISKCDYVIHNNSDLATLRREVDMVLQKILCK